MRKKALVSIMLAALVALMTPMVAMADTHTHNGSDASVHDELSEDFEYGIVADGNVECKTTGKVGSESLDDKAIMANNGATVEAGSATNNSTAGCIVAKNNSTVTVSGAVYNKDGTAVKATNSKVEAGSVKADALDAVAVGDSGYVKVHGEIEGHSVGVTMCELGKVEAGSIKAENHGIVIEGLGATAIVKGNVDAGICGITVWNGYSDDYNEVSVFGTLKAATGISIVNPGDEDYAINVYKIDSAKPIDDAVDKSAIEKHVYYIVKDTSASKIGSFTLSSTDAEDIGTAKDGFGADANIYQTARKNTSGYTVTVQEVSGYTLKSIASVDNALAVLTPNGDGTYTLIVPEGGGVSLEMVYEAIQQQSSSVPEGGDISPEQVYEVIQQQSSSSSGSSSVITYKKGWNKSGTNWQYVKSNGAFARNEWIQIDGKRYHFGNDAMMDTGWFLDTDGSWYYLCKEEGQNIGVMMTGWITDPDDGYRYYLDTATGNMLIGSHEIDGKQYYFAENVIEASGWTQNDNEDWVYEKRDVIPFGATK